MSVQQLAVTRDMRTILLHAESNCDALRNLVLIRYCNAYISVYRTTLLDPDVYPRPCHTGRLQYDVGLPLPMS